ncbi:helix-turn-helix domain-containing protein [Amorphoplanes digitatis]|uniref:Transcriptional regulator with XRE-family HTH domain n=1 Tax=Actinoplanes digitatis TaxID=1868 RepID=A0A7W7HW45_9ACTN|nr:helix-turn-helix domain-containing protein [Actinoplanes digitatis]MBB4761845.1 transcriptional regulator with XRE-family HTH domain [Actinoplanes digitatis]
MISNRLLRLRLQRGLTQEELSELSGISVRTIRNLERGQIQAPRRSSIEMLLNALGPEPSAGPGRPALGVAVEWTRLAESGGLVWRGARPPRTSLIGRDTDAAELTSRVAVNRVVVVTGPGGVGKSRIALAVAGQLGHRFPDGVFVAELGRIPAERDRPLDSTMELLANTVGELLGADPEATGRHRLLVLDHAEHLPEATTRLVERLLGEDAELHIVITTRRPPRLPDACIWDIEPLPEPAAAELVIDRVRAGCPSLDLSGEAARVAQLCRYLDGLPRLIEFAAHRLRMVSLPTLLAGGQAVLLLGQDDFAGLPHQRTLAASLRWSLDLLDERHRAVLHRLARLPGPVAVEGEFGTVEAMGILADLVDSSLLLVDRSGPYRYWVPSHLRAFVAAGGLSEPDAAVRRAG